MATIYLSSVEILSKNTILVTFSEPLSTSASNYLASSYTVSGSAVRAVISPVDDSSPLDVVLVTDRLSEDASYTLSASSIVAASGNLLDDAVTIEFPGRITKLDKALGSTPILYDTAPDSTIRQVLTAIHRENDKIGGEGAALVQGDAPAIQGPFTWSGMFPFPATSEDNLLKYLGVDGSFDTPDISAGSQLYQLTSSGAVNIGTINNGETFNNTGSPNVTYGTDPDFRRELEDVTEFAQGSEMLATGGTGIVPSVMDGTKSFIIGMILKIDALPGVNTARDLARCYFGAGFRGWRLLTFDGGAKDKRTGLAVYQGSGDIREVNSSASHPIVFGESFALIANVDVAAGLMKIMTSTPGSYAELAFADTSNFAASSGFHLSETTYGIDGLIGQVFCVEYDYTVDAEFGEAHMVQFLKYCDGYLTI